MTDNQTNTPKQVSKGPLSLTRSISRMAVGGIMLGLEVITGSQKTQDQPDPAIQVVKTDDERVFYDVLPDSDDVGLKSRRYRVRQSDQALPHIMTGVLIDASQRVSRVIHTFDFVTGRVGRAVEPVISPFINNPLVRPFRRGFDGLVTRGEGQVNRWKQLGMDEDKEGRELIQTITISTLDTSIDYVAQQPEVLDLATTKTKSLAAVLLEYLRSFIVTMDIILLGAISNILRLPSLSIPVPPTEGIRKGASWSIREQEEDISEPYETNLEHTHIGFYAGTINRIAALFIDLFIVGISLNISLWFLSTSADLLGLYVSDISLFDINLSKVLSVSIIGASFFAIYNTLLWALFGNTVGQALLGIRVLIHTGELPGLVRSLLRATIGMSLSISLFIITLIMMIFDRRNRALHDRIFGTVVVYTWDAHPAERFINNLVDKFQVEGNESDSKLV